MQSRMWFAAPAWPRAWQFAAACRVHDPDLWFPAGGTKEGRTRAKWAKRICRSCPVRTDCRDWIDHLERHSGQHDGIWGGQDYGERLRRRKAERMRKVIGPNSESPPPARVGENLVVGQFERPPC